jgi:hypothetical protein
MKRDIYYFNPTCELAVANGSTNYMASEKLHLFEEELSTLPGILAKPTDLVLVNSKPPQQFIDQLESAGFVVPAYETADDLLSSPAFQQMHNGFLFPWGWSPAAHKQLLQFKSNCSIEFQSSPVSEWREIHRELYGRKSSLDLLTQFVTRYNSGNILEHNNLPEICTDHRQIIPLQKKWEKVVVKAPWSASGRGLQILRPKEYNQSNRQIIGGFLKKQGYVVVGPWHEKVLDLSFQFFSSGNGNVEYMGLTTFSTDGKGRYIGNHIQEFPADLESEVKKFMVTNLPEIHNSLQKILSTSHYSTEYYGWLGVDAMIYIAEDGTLKIHPCLEINCRFTMGAIALKLREHLDKESVGEFKILNGKKGDFNRYCRDKMANRPLEIENGKIRSGFLPLTPLVPESTFGAYIKIMKE